MDLDINKSEYITIMRLSSNTGKYGMLPTFERHFYKSCGIFRTMRILTLANNIWDWGWIMFWKYPTSGSNLLNVCHIKLQIFITYLMRFDHFNSTSNFFQGQSGMRALPFYNINLEYNHGIFMHIEEEEKFIFTDIGNNDIHQLEWRLRTLIVSLNYNFGESILILFNEVNNLNL